MNDKSFKSHNDLLLILESRGISFSERKSKANTKKHLQRIGYYRLINGYGYLFFDNGQKDVYIPGTTVDEIFSVYSFDAAIRALMLRYILPFESNIKALIAYVFPQNHPETNYLAYYNFDTSRRDSMKIIADLISRIQRQLADRVHDPSISHYLSNYGYVPLWVLNNVLTFGNVSRFYSLMLQSERQEIAKVFKLQDFELENILTCISTIRNICAHGDRLLCYRSKRPLVDTKYHVSFGIPASPSGEYIYGKRDLFSVMIALKLVLSYGDFHSFLQEFNTELSLLSSGLHVISIDNILSVMGFPKDWYSTLR